MKKFVVLISVGLLMLAFGTVYAQEKAPVLDFKASGFIDVISEWTMNVPQNPPSMANNFGGALSSIAGQYVPAGPAFDKSTAYMESRGRLRFDAIMGKEMMGTFFFEMDSTRWGERVPSGNDQRNNAGYWGVADRGAVELKNMFITFGVPVIPIPTTIQAGIHPLAVRPGAFCGF
jgi:hypothetical protein